MKHVPCNALLYETGLLGPIPLFSASPTSYTAMYPARCVRWDRAQPEISPFVHPAARTSLLAQSNDQHDVPSNSMRSAGSDNFTV